MLKNAKTKIIWGQFFSAHTSATKVPFFHPGHCDNLFLIRRSRPLPLMNDSFAQSYICVRNVSALSPPSSRDPAWSLFEIYTQIISAGYLYRGHGHANTIAYYSVHTSIGYGLVSISGWTLPCRLDLARWRLHHPDHNLIVLVSL